MRKVNLELYIWPAWIVRILLWPLANLPAFLQRNLGKLFGKILYFFPTTMKHVTDVNLRLCFPELPQKERDILAKKNFDSLGIAFIETAMAWLLPQKKLAQIAELHGFHYVEQGIAKGNGVILLMCHFTCVEMLARLIGMQNNCGVIYRPHKKKFIELIHDSLRKKHFNHYIPNNQIRQLLTALKQNKAIGYAYDVDAGSRGSVFVPFFGIQTATLTTVSRIARLSNAVVIPMSYYRRDNELKYDIVFSPPLDNFPSDDLTQDAARLNAILEEAIRKKPEQYVWQYKRFKTRPSRFERRFYYSSNFPPRHP